MAKLNCTVPYILCHSKSSNGWLVYYKHTCDDDWNHPVVDKATIGVIEMPSTVQSITSLLFSRSHSSFARFQGNHNAQGDGCADLAMSHISLTARRVKNLDVLQHNVFLLITRADTNSHISKMSIFCGRLFMSVTDTTDPQTEKSRYFSQLCHFCTKYLQAPIK